MVTTRSDSAAPRTASFGVRLRTLRSRRSQASNQASNQTGNQAGAQTAVATTLKLFIRRTTSSTFARLLNAEMRK